MFKIKNRRKIIAMMPLTQYRKKVNSK